MDRPDATRNVKDLEPAPYLISRYYMKTLLADHQGFGILLQDTPRLGLSADTVLDVQDALAETARACAAGCDFEIDAADADIARCIASGGYRGGAKVAAVYVPVGDLPRETTVFADMDRALASIGLDRPETETLAEYDGVTVSLLRAAGGEDGGLKPNRALCRDGETEIIRGGFLVVATGRDGGLVDLPGGRSRAPRSASPTPRRAPSGQPPSSRGRCAAPSASRSSGRGGRPPTSPRWCRSSPRSREGTAGRTGSTSEKNRARRGRRCIDSGLHGYQFCNQAAASYPIVTQTHRRGLVRGSARRQNPDRRPEFRPAPPPHPPERASDAGICWCG